MGRDFRYIALIAVVILIVASGVAFGIGKLFGLPLPCMGDKLAIPNYDEQNRLIERWESVQAYGGHEDDKAIDVEEDEMEIVESTDDDADVADFFQRFNEVDKESFEGYLKAIGNEELADGGFDRVVLGKVDKTNTSTGIKTIHDDDILTIDTDNNIMVIGLEVGGQKGKLAVLKEKGQLGYSVVDDLTYWDRIDRHAEREKAILAINASGYSWNSTGNYGTLYGLALRKGDLIRRARRIGDIVGFTEEGDMKVGEYPEDLYNACEYYPTLIKDGERAYKGGDDSRIARTAIGQTEDGSILFLVVDGDRGTEGATISELVEIMERYGAVNAANLSEGICTVMWWNGKIVNNPYGEGSGVRLPTVWVVKSNR